MNNKRLGTEFEREVCAWYADHGYWVHFIAPDARGAQPFDIIAVRNGEAFAIDCKTSIKNRFPFSRLEDNQKLAFEKWRACGNNEPLIAVKYQGTIYMIEYDYLKNRGVVDLTDLEGINNES